MFVLIGRLLTGWIGLKLPAMSLPDDEPVGSSAEIVLRLSSYDFVLQRFFDMISVLFKVMMTVDIRRSDQKRCFRPPNAQSISFIA